MLFGDPVPRGFGVGTGETRRAQVREPARNDSTKPSFHRASARLQRIRNRAGLYKGCRDRRGRSSISRGGVSVHRSSISLGFREEAVPADVEAETLVTGRCGDPADILRVGLEDRDRVSLFGEDVSRRQAAGPAPMTATRERGRKPGSIFSPMLSCARRPRLVTPSRKPSPGRRRRRPRRSARRWR